MSVHAVVPTFNSARHIDRCLRELLHQDGIQVSVVVVDNDSSDTTVARARRLPQVRVIELVSNAGYGSALNVGATDTDSHVLALNADAYLAPSALARLCDVLDRDPTVGVVAPRLSNIDGTLQPSAHKFPTLARLIGEALMLDRPRCLRRWLDYHERDHRYDRPGYVDWATGAVLLIRNTAWHAVGGFDAAYEFYVEEVDLQRRLRDCGYRVLLEPGAVAVHEGGKRPVEPQQFAKSHDGFERYFNIHVGRLSGRMARAVLCVTAATRAMVWRFRMLTAEAHEERSEAQSWERMFLGTLRLSVPRLIPRLRR